MMDDAALVAVERGHTGCWDYPWSTFLRIGQAK